jgi:rod shape-determining protein MreD
MLTSLLSYTLWGLVLFYLHELLLYPQVFLRPLAPLLLYASLRDSLPVAFALAVILGLLQDSYTLTPFGVHVAGSLLLVMTARLARERFLLKSALSLMLAMLAALVLQELGVRLILTLLGSEEVFFENLTWPQGLELVVTAVVTPAFFALFRAWDNLLRRLGRSPRRRSASW